MKKNATNLKGIRVIKHKQSYKALSFNFSLFLLKAKNCYHFSLNGIFQRLLYSNYMILPLDSSINSRTHICSICIIYYVIQELRVCGKSQE